jgi:hypothetical protein
VIRQDVIGPRPDPTQVPYFVSRITHRKSTTKENKKEKASYAYPYPYPSCHIVSLPTSRQETPVLPLFSQTHSRSRCTLSNRRDLICNTPQRSRSSRGRVAAFPPVIIVHTVTFRHQIHFPGLSYRLSHRISLGQRSSPAQFPQF